MNEQEQDRIKNLLQQTLPPITADAEPARDLWPAMLRRMNAKSATQPQFLPAQFLPVWFDWALLACIVGVVAVFPSSIPLLLYYL
ncbi:MAG: hypothetical protein ABR923_21865 [Terracidiphilus sp.]|jgi:hypothetical protein